MLQVVHAIMEYMCDDDKHEIQAQQNLYTRRDVYLYMYQRNCFSIETFVVGT